MFHFLPVTHRPRSLNRRMPRSSTFIGRLWKVVNEGGVCKWIDDGKAFCIVDEKGFETSGVLQRLSKSFSGFVRQLHLHGFSKSRTVEDGFLKFTNSCFRKDRPDLLHLIKPKRPKRKKRGSVDFKNEQRESGNETCSELENCATCSNCEHLKDENARHVFKNAAVEAENQALRKQSEQIEHLQLQYSLMEQKCYIMDQEKVDILGRLNFMVNKAREYQMQIACLRQEIELLQGALINSRESYQGEKELESDKLARMSLEENDSDFENGYYDGEYQIVEQRDYPEAFSSFRH